MKSILLLVHDDDGQSARLNSALDLAHVLGAHLGCLDVTPPLVYGGNNHGGFGDPILLNDEREIEARNKARLTERLKHAGVAWSWEDAMGDMADCVIDRAMLADLIVLNCALEDTVIPDMRTVASRVLMHARAPIVAVPEQAEGFSASGRALIAWDGQGAAAATMRACIPLLQRACDVHIFMVRNGAGKVDADAAGAYLARHNISATIKIIDDDGVAIDHLIAAESQRWNADYVMMGAYSHGRLAETFGGVTKRMLKDSALPLVLGH